MLFIYHSNCLESFTKYIINIMSSNRLSNLMQSEIILINNKVVEKWIEIKLTNHFGISANIKFMNIISFIKKISENILGYDLDINNFSQDFIFWKFMEILPKISFKKECTIIRNYLHHDLYQQKLGQLSEQLSYLFSEYLIYRSDWLDSWSINKVIDNIDNEYQFWQSEIWRSFLKKINSPYKELKSWNYYINLIQKNIKKVNSDRLPKRIFIYGVMLIPPIFWKVLNLLSYRIDIYFWFMDPCINSLKYFSNNRPHIKNNIYVMLNQNNDYQNNNIIISKYTLLQKWGKIGQDILCLLGELKNFSIIQDLKIPKKDSILHVLQKDILKTKFYQLDLKNNQLSCTKITNKKRHVIKSSDYSITIHICHNIQREIEILHDNLLLMLSNNPELSPGDIIVMAPNISDYSSSIKNVFNNIFNRKLPFTISSRLEKHMHPIILALLQILKISYSRFTSEEILSLLSVSAIAARFNISIKEMQLLNKWVVESGIRWGLDDKTMYTFDLPVTDQNTWYFGLKRMLLGYAINSEDGLWENIFPFDYINEECMCIVSKLGEFLNMLKKWRYILNFSYTLTRWMSYIQDITNDFLDYNNLNLEEKKVLFLFKDCWINVVQSGIQSGYCNSINIITLLDILQVKLSQKKIDYKFLPNSINFYDIDVICYIPCKVLCIIGMNNNAFPRNVFLSNFNLILKKKCVGDNDIYEKDCYLFLLACLLPREKIYISFIKQLNYDNNNSMDSSSRLVNELLEYITQRFFIKENSNLDNKDNVKYVSKHVLRHYSDIIFSINNFNNSITKSFANEWISAVNTSISSNNVSIDLANFINKLPEISITTILFNELYRFYQHPIRIWFQKRLGVYFPVYTQKLLNNEPFYVNHINRFSLNMKIIDCLLYNKDLDKLYYESYASGLLPYGAFGKLFWIKEYDRMTKLVSQIKPFYSVDQIYKLEFSMKFETIELIGQLNMVQNHGLIRWKPSGLSMKDCFLLWLEHIIYCAIGGTGDSKLFGINNTWHFPNFTRSVAKKFLYSLISGYCKGMNMPLMLLYKSGGIWINSVFNWNNKMICTTSICQEKARYKLIQAWEGKIIGDYNKYYDSTGENQDPYLRKLISLHLNEDNIKHIINVAKYYFLDIMQYRVF